MRVTIDLDDDILNAAKHIACEREQSVDRTLSDLIRKGIQSIRGVAAPRGIIPVLYRKPGGHPVTSQIVRELLESEP